MFPEGAYEHVITHDDFRGMAFTWVAVLERGSLFTFWSNTVLYSTEVVVYQGNVGLWLCTLLVVMVSHTMSFPSWEALTHSLKTEEIRKVEEREGERDRER